MMQATAAAAAEKDKEALAEKDPEAGGAVLAALTDDDADAHGSKVCMYLSRLPPSSLSTLYMSPVPHLTWSIHLCIAMLFFRASDWGHARGPRAKAAGAAAAGRGDRLLGPAERGGDGPTLRAHRVARRRYVSTTHTVRLICSLLVWCCLHTILGGKAGDEHRWRTEEVVLYRGQPPNHQPLQAVAAGASAV